MTNCAQKRNPCVIKKVLVIFEKCSLNEKLINYYTTDEMNNEFTEEQGEK